MILMVVVVAANVVMALLVSTQGRGDQHFLPLLPCFLLAFVFCHTKQQKMWKTYFKKYFPPEGKFNSKMG